MITKKNKKEYTLFIEQYRKVRNTINSVKTIEQWIVAKKLLKILSNWWVSDGPMIKPFSYKDENEPINRVGELERFLYKKREELKIL